MKIFVLDNYDSFVFNLVSYLSELGAEVTVARNDATSASAIIASDTSGVVISPGPGVPSDAGIANELVSKCAEAKLPLLGVCLGHQAIGEVFGAKITKAAQIMHGRTSEIDHDGIGIFDGLPNPFTATRYHSLCVDPDTIPSELIVTATEDQGCIMGLRHNTLPIEGVQFHPESILTTNGKQLLSNWLTTTREPLKR